MDKPIENFWQIRLADVKTALEANNFEVFLAEKQEDVHKIVSVEDASGLTITNIYDNQVSVQPMQMDVTNFGLLIPPTDGKEHLLLFSNGSWDKRAEITVTPAATIRDTAVYNSEDLQ